MFFPQTSNTLRCLAAFAIWAVAKKSSKTFASQDDHAFGYTRHCLLRSRRHVSRTPRRNPGVDPKPTHKLNYHYELKIPVAPEAYERDLTLFGDQYSNSDAGKILLYLEDMGGLHVSIPDQNQWTRIRYRHDHTQVDGNPILWEVLNAC